MKNGGDWASDTAAPRWEHDNMQPVHPVCWSRAWPSEDGLSVSVAYMTSRYFLVERIEVSETDRTVTITVFERIPEGLSPLAASPRIREVGLEKPLAGRSIIDGAPGKGGLPPLELPPAVEKRLDRMFGNQPS